MLKRFKEGLFGIAFCNAWWITTKWEAICESSAGDVVTGYTLAMLVMAGIWHICDSIMYITTGNKP